MHENWVEHFSPYFEADEIHKALVRCANAGSHVRTGGGVLPETRRKAVTAELRSRDAWPGGGLKCPPGCMVPPEPKPGIMGQTP